MDTSKLAEKLMPAAAALDDDVVWATCRALGAELDPDVLVDAVTDPTKLAAVTLPVANDVLRRWSESGRDDLLEAAASVDGRVGVHEASVRLRAQPRSRPHHLGELWGFDAAPADLLDRLAATKPFPGHGKFAAAAGKVLRKAACDPATVADALISILSGADPRFGVSAGFVVDRSTPTVNGAELAKVTANVNQLLAMLPIGVRVHVADRAGELDVWARAVLTIALCGAPVRHSRRSAAPYRTAATDLAAAAELLHRSGGLVWRLAQMTDAGASTAESQSTASVLASLLDTALRSGVPVTGPLSLASLAGCDADLAAADTSSLDRLVGVLSNHHRRADVTEVLTAASRGGEKPLRLPGFDVRLFTPDTPFAVVAAAAPGWFDPSGSAAFITALNGTYGHRWTPEEIVAGLDANPEVATAVATAAPMSSSSSSVPTTTPRWLVEFSMRRAGLASWLERHRAVAAELAAELAGHGPDTISTALTLAVGGFRGTPAELVAVAAAASPST